MRLKFYAAREEDGRFKNQPGAISSALSEGIKSFGDEIEIVHNATFNEVDPDVDIACVWGIMGNSSEIVSRYLLRGKRVIMFDKALIRHMDGGARGYFRVGIDGPSPVKYMMRVPRNFDRYEFRFRNVDFKSIPEPTITRPRVLYCGSSQKYCDFYKLGDANDYAEDVFKQVRESSQKVHIVYRPKPSWDGARLIEGSHMSPNNASLGFELSRCNMLITHGSAASVEAIVAGIPVITLGPCVAQFVANHEVNARNLTNPYFPSDNARWQWLCNLAYCQWTASELQSGEAWNFIRNEIIETKRQ